MATTRYLRLGEITIEWDAQFAFPIAIDHEQEDVFVTQCAIDYRWGIGRYALLVERGYRFDGASIPWLVRLLPWWRKLGWHLLAALPHDWVCDHPELLPRPVGDGIFLSVLLGLARSGFQRRQAWVMYVGVWAYTVWLALRGGWRAEK